MRWRDRTMWLVALGVLCLLASPALAADGDEVTPREIGRALYYLCDSKTAGFSGPCPAAGFPVRNVVQTLAVQAVINASCTAYSAKLEFSLNNDDWSELATFSCVSGPTCAGASDISMIRNLSRSNPKYVRVNVTSIAGAGCDWDVIMDIMP